MRKFKQVMLSVLCLFVILGTAACGTRNNTNDMIPNDNNMNDATEGINDIGNGIENITDDMTGNQRK